MPSKRRKPSAGGKARPEDLPDAELEVLACLWNRGEATAAQVRQSLAEFRPMAHGSVLTLLKRLADKGLVTREKAGQGKAFLYRPTRRAEPTYRRILGRLTQRLFGGNPVALVASLFQGRTPSPDELRQIRDLLGELEGRRPRKGAQE